MNYLRPATICLLAIAVWHSPSGVQALDCICCKYPGFPYSGDYWVHYAIKTRDACVNDYSCAHIQQYTSTPETCDAISCGNCSPLGKEIDIPTVVASDSHFGTLPKYQEVDEPDQILNFLINNGGSESVNADRLRCFEFQSPIEGAAPPVVQLQRATDDGSQLFYAILWKMRFKANNICVKESSADWHYFGIEVDTRGATPTVWTPAIDGTFRAVVLVPDGALKQAITVKGLLEVKVRGQFCLVRLHASNINKAADAFPLRYARRP